MATTSLEEVLAKGDCFHEEFLKTLNPADLLAGLRQLQTVFTAYADFLPAAPEEEEPTVADAQVDDSPTDARNSLARVIDDQQRLTKSLTHLRVVMNLPEDDEATLDLRTLLMCVNQDYLNPAMQALSAWLAARRPDNETASSTVHPD